MLCSNCAQVQWPNTENLDVHEWSVWDDNTSFIQKDVNQGKYYIFNVGHINFSPTLIRKPNVVQEPFQPMFP